MAGKALWHVPVTIAVVTVVSAAQTTAELLWPGLNPGQIVASLAPFLLGHLIAGAVSALLFTLIALLRSGRQSSLRYSERYLVGLGYGLATSLLTSVACAALLASSAGQTVEYAGGLMSASLVGLQLPIAGIIGGLTWHLLTRVREGVPVPQRAARPWEDS